MNTDSKSEFIRMLKAPEKRGSAARRAEDDPKVSLPRAASRLAFAIADGDPSSVEQKRAWHDGVEDNKDAHQLLSCMIDCLAACFTCKQEVPKWFSRCWDDLRKKTSVGAIHDSIRSRNFDCLAEELTTIAFMRMELLLSRLNSSIEHGSTDDSVAICVKAFCETFDRIVMTRGTWPAVQSFIKTDPEAISRVKQYGLRNAGDARADDALTEVSLSEPLFSRELLVLSSHRLIDLRLEEGGLEVKLTANGCATTKEAVVTTRPQSPFVPSATSALQNDFTLGIAAFWVPIGRPSSRVQTKLTPGDSRSNGPS
tara:strand:+ start:171186 stop:172121 length:936 start_codon:yes stop_codon:yes gene_type:complete